MSDIFTQAIDLLTQKNSDLVYHLIVLFALEAMLGMAIVRARRTGWTTPLRHIAIAAAVLLIGRVVLMVVALLGLQGIPPGLILANAITPPLERAIDLISLGFVAWAFVPLLRDNRQLGFGLLIINSIAALIVYVVLAAQWYNQSAAPDRFYAATSQETIWQVWSLVIAAGSALAIALGRGERSGVGIVAFAALAIGHALQLFAPPLTSHIAGWVRLAQLTAYPLFAINVFQLTLVDGSPRSAAAIAVPASTSLDLNEPTWQMLETIRRINAQADMPLALQQIAASFAHALHADVAAIGLLSDVPNSIDLVAIHHPGASPAPGAIFIIDKQPNVKRALERRRPIVVEPNEAAPELVDLYGLMGSFVVGPLLIMPLHDETEAMGVILVGNPASGRKWTAAEVQYARALSEYLAAVLALTHHTQRLTARADELEGTLSKLDTESTQRRLALETALQQTQAEAQHTAARLASLAQLQEELSAQRGSAEARWEQQLQQTIEERARLEQDVRERQDEADRLTQLQVALEAELKDAQQQITQLQDQLKRPERIASAIETPEVASAEFDHKREVVASIVQELRTPMTSITGYTDLLLGESVGILGAMQRQFLQRVKANIERMDGMLDDLIGVTTIDAGQIKIEPEPVDVAEVIEDTVMAAAGLFRERELSIRIELADGLPKIHADRDSLHQIIKHLLSNAALCSPTHSEIVLRTQLPPDMSNFLLFSITDHGGGIAPEDRQRAFHRMYRADHPLIEGLGETGVGLSISKALVEAQGGRIWVDSEMGVGSTFTFILPLNSNHVGMPA